MSRAVLILFLFTLPVSLISQFRHMHYNLTLYGNPFSCDENNNNTDAKDAALDVIIDYAQPDLFTVNELRDGNLWANRILNNVLNDDSELWARASLTGQFTSSSILNGLFYRSDKFFLESQETVHLDLDGGLLLRPIDIYNLYLMDEGLFSGDTTRFSCAVAHLAASDEQERSDQTEAFVSRIEELGPGNYIFSGDLNIDSAFEEAFQNLVSHPNDMISFIDPITISPNWNNNPSIAQYHTQSTRFSDTNAGCFSGGGLDDRFDITLLSQSILEGSDGISFISDSYLVLGQNGNDYNQELQTFNNGAVPDEVATALYDMSDHLPVLTEFNTEFILSAEQGAFEIPFEIFIQEQSISVSFSRQDDYQVELFDISGKLVKSRTSLGDGLRLETPSGGIYILRVSNKAAVGIKKILVN
ncbi:MAG: T9SS type A sorting domain-containing protein [Flavobacteriales bacterium]|nr:T9SS type A sorting domain-containing protein [Flavobacteriales bacterium]